MSNWKCKCGHTASAHHLTSCLGSSFCGCREFQGIPDPPTDGMTPVPSVLLDQLRKVLVPGGNSADASRQQVRAAARAVLDWADALANCTHPHHMVVTKGRKSTWVCPDCKVEQDHEFFSPAVQPTAEDDQCASCGCDRDNHEMDGSCTSHESCLGYESLCTCGHDRLRHRNNHRSCYNCPEGCQRFSPSPAVCPTEAEDERESAVDEVLAVWAKHSKYGYDPGNMEHTVTLDARWMDNLAMALNRLTRLLAPSVPTTQERAEQAYQAFVNWYGADVGGPTSYQLKEAFTAGFGAAAVAGDAREQEDRP